jgi:hypothetical protein
MMMMMMMQTLSHPHPPPPPPLAKMPGRRAPVLSRFLGFICGLQLAYVIIIGFRSIDPSSLPSVRLSGGSGGENETLLPIHPIFGLVQSYPASPKQHDSTRRRTVLSLTATPAEMDRLHDLISTLLQYSPYEQLFDAIHLSIPHESSRFPDLQYPSLTDLQRMYTDKRIILHRLDDFGPLTRYIGPLAYEKHSDTAIVILDIDSQGMEWQIRGRSYDQHPTPVRDLVQLVHYSNQLDPAAMWCLAGEDFFVNEAGQVTAAWDTFPRHNTTDMIRNDHDVENSERVSWNLVHFCRGVGGLLFRPRQFREFWYNQTAYHESCYWDDDRWVAFQMERLGVDRKALHLLPRRNMVAHAYSHLFSRRHRAMNFHGRRLGAISGLTKLNAKLESDQTCTKAWIQHHNETFPTAKARYQ